MYSLSKVTLSVNSGERVPLKDLGFLRIIYILSYYYLECRPFNKENRFFGVSDQSSLRLFLKMPGVSEFRRKKAIDSQLITYSMQVAQAIYKQVFPVYMILQSQHAEKSMLVPSTATMWSFSAPSSWEPLRLRCRCFHCPD